MENNTEISARVKQVIEYLQLNSNKFGKALGYERPQTIYDILSGKSAPSYDFFRRLQDTEYSEKIDFKWLLTGKGDISPKKEKVLMVSEPSMRYEKTEKEYRIPLIPLKAVAGISNGDNTAILTVDCVYYDVPEFNNKADYLIRITGSSMSPKYHSGDVVACKKVQLPATFFQWNKVYVLDTDQGALVKRVKKSKAEDYIQLFSDNPNYEPFDIPINTIHALGLVVGVIRLE